MGKCNKCTFIIRDLPNKCYLEKNNKDGECKSFHPIGGE